jgi:hypothetical protein
MVLWAWFFFFQIPRPGGSLIPKHFQIPWTDDEGCLILSIFQIPRTDGSLILNFFKYPEPRVSFFDSGFFLFFFFFFKYPYKNQIPAPTLVMTKGFCLHNNQGAPQFCNLRWELRDAFKMWPHSKILGNWTTFLKLTWTRGVLPFEIKGVKLITSLFHPNLIPNLDKMKIFILGI